MREEQDGRKRSCLGFQPLESPWGLRHRSASWRASFPGGLGSRSELISTGSSTMDSTADPTQTSVLLLSRSQMATGEETLRVRVRTRVLGVLVPEAEFATTGQARGGLGGMPLAQHLACAYEYTRLPSIASGKQWR